MRANWAFHANDEQVIGALTSGTHASSLREYFGRATYLELRALAKKSRHRCAGAYPRVLILPGIMGSKLSEAPGRGGKPQLLWIDPLKVADGQLTALKYPGSTAIAPTGTLLFSYAKLWFALHAAGCDVRFHSFDWRLDIEELGAQLAGRILADRPVVLVGHSMGGLVARAAMKQLPKHAVKKLIMVGTPNYGSFAPVQALRGTYPFVRHLATFDLKHTPEFLAQEVFCSFPGLYQLLPAPARRRGKGLFDPGSWPVARPAPNPDLLKAAAKIHRKLAPANGRMAQIVGVDQETIVDVRRIKSGFEYRMNRNGDGTVPLTLALLPRVPRYFVKEQHGALANNPQVIQAVVNLVRRGRTQALARRWTRKRAPVTFIDDATLRATDREKIDWRQLNSAQREAALAKLDERD